MHFIKQDDVLIALVEYGHCGYFSMTVLNDYAGVKIPNVISTDIYS